MKKKKGEFTKRLEKLVIVLSKQFADWHGLRHKRFVCTDKKRDFSGLCEYDGVITYRLVGKEPYEVLELIAHELAHLAHFDHNEKWMRLYAELMCDMLSRGVLQQIKEVCPILPA